MKFLFFFLFIFCCFSCKAFISYFGFIENLPIQMIIDDITNSNIDALYCYDKFDVPIKLKGELKKQQLFLYEIDDTEHTQKTMILNYFDKTKDTISGYFIDNLTESTLRVTLIKEFDFSIDSEYSNKEIIQPQTTKEHYFKLLISYNNDSNYPFVTGVKVFEKKTDRIVHTFDLDCQLWGLENISVYDYNFDGIEDFSVFERSYAGPNTTSIYILRIPDKDKYFISDFSGTSLFFDSESKTVHSHNQCCAGSMHQNAEYKIVNNKMILIKQRCYKYDDEIEDFIEEPCNEEFEHNDN